jgi:hypothetical protein
MVDFQMPLLMRIDFWLLYALCLGLVLGAVRIGAHVGERVRQAGGQNQYGLHGLDNAALGLLALMIGFTFAIALNRFDARRNGLLDEANAIGTAWLRAGMLPAPYGPEARDLLTDYTRIRLEVASEPLSSAGLAKAVQESNALQTKLWAIADAAAKALPQPVPTGMFVDALNTVIDLQETRLTEGRTHVPTIVFGLLVVTAALAGAFTGYTGGLAGDRRGIADLVMAVLIVSVIMTIFDLDSPNSGLIGVSAQPLRNLAASIGLPHP